MDTKKLRQKILDLAIRGKLVPQDPNDEPASLLLERIRAEKERLIKEGKIKRSKKTATNDDIEAPFEIPESWEWVRLDDIAFITKLAGFEYTNYIADNLSRTTGIPLFKGKNVQDGKIVYEFESFIPKNISEVLPRSQVYKKCLLTPYVGTIGNIGIHEKEGFFHLGSNVGKIELFNDTKLNVLEEYVRYFLMSNDGYKELTKHKKATAQDSISIDAIRDCNVPLPPIKEQKRIITQIDYWLSQVTSIEENENGIVEFVNKAKSKILDLAIHGKLVPQNPNDEPAIELLKRINPKFEPCDDEYYWDIPSNWILTRVDDIGELLSGRDLSSDVCNNESKGIPYLIGASNISGDTFSFVRWTELPQVISILGDVLISCKGTIGAIIENNVGNIHIARQFMAIRPKNHCISSDYLKICLLAIIEGIKKNARGVIPGISRDDILEKSIPLPPINEQPRIVSQIEEVFKALDALS